MLGGMPATSRLHVAAITAALCASLAGCSEEAPPPPPPTELPSPTESRALPAPCDLLDDDEAAEVLGLDEVSGGNAVGGGQPTQSCGWTAGKRQLVVTTMPADAWLEAAAQTPTEELPSELRDTIEELGPDVSPEQACEVWTDASEAGTTITSPAGTEMLLVRDEEQSGSEVQTCTDGRVVLVGLSGSPRPDVADETRIASLVDSLSSSSSEPTS